MRTMLVAMSLILSLALGSPPTAAADADGGDSEAVACAELGFPAVSCSTCQRVADIVADEGGATDTCMVVECTWKSCALLQNRVWHHR